MAGLGPNQVGSRKRVLRSEFRELGRKAIVAALCAATIAALPGELLA